MSYDALDLKRGVLELFVEASYLPRIPLRYILTNCLRDREDGELQLQHGHGKRRHSFEESEATLRRLERRAAAARERIQARAWKTQMRAARLGAREKLLQACLGVVTQETCPSCGGVVERREGLARLQHVGVRAGACLAKMPGVVGALVAERRA